MDRSRSRTRAFAARTRAALLACFLLQASKAALVRAAKALVRD